MIEPYNDEGIRRLRKRYIDNILNCNPALETIQSLIVTAENEKKYSSNLFAENVKLKKMLKEG